jgi:hypothetical protein
MADPALDNRERSLGTDIGLRINAIGSSAVDTKCPRDFLPFLHYDLAREKELVSTSICGQARQVVEPDYSVTKIGTTHPWNQRFVFEKLGDRNRSVNIPCNDAGSPTQR